MPADPGTSTRRERAAVRRARRRRRQSAVAAGMFVVPLAVAVWGLQQPRPLPPAAAEGSASALGRLSPVLASAMVTRPAAGAGPGAAPARVAAVPAAAPAPAAGGASDPVSAAVRSSAVPVPVPVAAGSGRLTVARGGTGPSASGPVVRYVVEVEDGIGEDVAAFARAVDATLADPRSWGAGGRMAFQRVAGGSVDFRVTLASPATTDRLCAPLDTDGVYSCHNEGRVVINGMRWARGADAYGRDLAAYRHYVINHEVGHALGHGHEGCPGKGRRAPVMMQQTIGVGACRPGPWPYAG